MTNRRPLALLPLLLLAACGPAPAAPQWSTVDAPLLGIRFLHPQALTVDSEDAEEPSVVWNGAADKVYGFRVPEDHVPDGIADWALPAGFSASLAKQPSCALLEGEGTYLPVNFAEPHVCEVVTREDGGRAVYAVGIGRPYEGFAFLESLLLVPTDAGVVVLQGVAPLSPFPPAADALLSSHPDAEFPNDEFIQANTELVALLRGMLAPPSPEVTQAATAAWRIAQSVTLTAPAAEDVPAADAPSAE